MMRVENGANPQEEARTVPDDAAEPLRLLLLAPHPFFETRGTPLAVRALLGVLSERGYHINVLTYEEGEPVRIPNCTIHRIRAPFGVKGIRPGFSVKKVLCDVVMLRECIRLVRRQRYDLIHAVEESSFMAILAKRLSGVPFIYDMDSSLAQQMMEALPVLRMVKGALVAAERWAVRESLGVLAVCRSIEQTALEHEPGSLVACVEDASMIRGEANGGEPLLSSIRESGPVVMYVGNLEPYQGIALLLESFEQTLQSLPAAQLVVIGGNAADVQRYDEWANRTGIGDNVHFLGPRPLSQLGSLLRQSDVLVSPRTRGYNTPMKIYSYLDSGRPVIATRLATHTQVLDDSVSVLVKPTVAAMSAALTRVLRDPQLRERLAAAAKKRVREEYSPAAFRRKINAFYDAVEQALPERLRRPETAQRMDPA